MLTIAPQNQDKRWLWEVVNLFLLKSSPTEYIRAPSKGSSLSYSCSRHYPAQCFETDMNGPKHR